MRTFKSFMAAFFITLCVLGLGVGLLVVGYNTRRIAEGEAVAQVSYRLDKGVITLSDRKGGSITLALAEEKTAAPLVPAPIRVSLRAVRYGIEALEKLIEKI